MASSRDLDPSLRPWADWILKVGNQYGSRFVFTSTRRSRAKQLRLYTNYRLGKSSIPAAPPGHSKHEFGMAFDIARIGVNPHDDPWLTWLGAVWSWVGGQYGGERDPVHFE